jgi:hypothetical protein
MVVATRRVAMDAMMVFMTDVSTLRRLPTLSNAGSFNRSGG